MRHGSLADFFFATLRTVRALHQQASSSLRPPRKCSCFAFAVALAVAAQSQLQLLLLSLLQLHLLLHLHLLLLLLLRREQWALAH